MAIFQAKPETNEFRAQKNFPIPEPQIKWHKSANFIVEICWSRSSEY